MLVVGRERAVERLEVLEVIGADHAGVADVDHVAAGERDRHAETDQEHERDEQDAVGERAEAAPGDPCHAAHNARASR